MLFNPFEYHQVVGSMQYGVLTRSKMSFSVNVLCQHMHNPSTIYWLAIKNFLRYLKNTTNHGLFYSHGNLYLQTFCDFNSIGNLDDCCSTFGFGIFLSNSLVSWNGKSR